MITLTVVLNVSEDIEKKIKRLRELGRASAEPEVSKPSLPPAPVKKPPRKSRRVSSIKEKERKKRILVGAAIVIVVILIISVGAYVYLQNRATWQLEDAKSKKLLELKSYFKPRSELMNSTIGQQTYNTLKGQILAAKSIEELNSINIKAAYDKAWQEYQAYVEEQKRIEYEKVLNQTKREKIEEIEIAFQPLLSMPLPNDLKTKTLNTLQNLEKQVMDATTIEQVNSTDVDRYLLELWRDYYYYLIDVIPTQNVVLEKGQTRRILTKTEAKAVLGGILDYQELTKYRVYRVEYVDIALVLSRDRINGAFLSPGDKVMVFAMNSTTKLFKEIANEGYVEIVLLPTDAGVISVHEAQSQSASSSSSVSTQYSEQRQTEYRPGDTPLSTGQTSTETTTTTQSSTQGTSASYTYNVDLSEILKAIAAGKIQSSEEVREQLRQYGWEVIDLEKESGMLVLDPNSRFLVILKVPSIFVPDILSNQESIYLAKVSG